MLRVNRRKITIKDEKGTQGLNAGHGNRPNPLSRKFGDVENKRKRRVEYLRHVHDKVEDIAVVARIVNDQECTEDPTLSVGMRHERTFM